MKKLTLTPIKTALRKNNIVRATELLNIYLQQTGINKTVSDMITLHNIQIDENIIKEIKGHKMVTVGNKSQKVKKVNKLGTIKGTNYARITIEQILIICEDLQPNFKKLSGVYINNDKIREQANREIAERILQLIPELKGYITQKNLGVLAEIFGKIALGLNGNFSYNECDIYLTEKKETIELKCNSYNEFSLNGTQDEKTIFEGETIEQVVRRCSKAKKYLIFEGGNLLDSLNIKNWIEMDKETYIAYCVKNGRITQDSKGNNVIRVKRNK